MPRRFDAPVANPDVLDRTRGDACPCGGTTDATEGPVERAKREMTERNANAWRSKQDAMGSGMPREGGDDPPTSSERSNPVEAAREKMTARNANAWTRPTSQSRTRQQALKGT